MNFAKYISSYDNYKSKIKNHVTEAVFYKASMEVVKEFNTTFWMTLNEKHWVETGKQYYKVWPAFIDMLSRLRLDIKICDCELPEIAVCVRLPDGNYIIENERAVTCFIISVQQKTLSFTINELTAKSYCIHTLPGMKLTDTVTWQEYLDQMQSMDVVEYNTNSKSQRVIDEKPHEEIIKKVVSLGVTILLLANDRSIIQPDVLAADRNRFDLSKSESERYNLVARAKRKGIIGWRIGEAYETIPHLRRPHFGWRHTGPGRTIPRFVPIKGSVVHRDKVTKIPTGHITMAGVEEDNK